MGVRSRPVRISFEMKLSALDTYNLLMQTAAELAKWARTGSRCAPQGKRVIATDTQHWEIRLSFRLDLTRLLCITVECVEGNTKLALSHTGKLAFIWLRPPSRYKNKLICVFSCLVRAEIPSAVVFSGLGFRRWRALCSPLGARTGALCVCQR